MKQTYSYQPDNCKIFPGFYETILDSDCEVENYNFSREDEEPECEIDWEPYKHDVCVAVTDALSEFLTADEEICDKVEFEYLSSPRYYNYSNDHIGLTLNLDLDALKNWLFADEQRKNGFNGYLKEKYTSYDGFCSFVENNIDDYFEKSFEEYSDVLIDYYVLVMMCGKTDVVDYFTKNSNCDFFYTLDEIVSDCDYKHLQHIANVDECAD